MEIGIFRRVDYYNRHGAGTFGAYLSEEMSFGKKNIYGTKAGVFLHAFIDLGMSIVYYTDFKRGNFKLRPEMGIGILGVRIVAGFNVPTINNKAFPELRRKNAQVTIQGTIPWKTKKLTERGKLLHDLFKN